MFKCDVKRNCLQNTFVIVSLNQLIDSVILLLKIVSPFVSLLFKSLLKQLPDKYERKDQTYNYIEIAILCKNYRSFLILQFISKYSKNSPYSYSLFHSGWFSHNVLSRPWPDEDSFWADHGRMKTASRQCLTFWLGVVRCLTLSPPHCVSFLSSEGVAHLLNSS